MSYHRKRSPILFEYHINNISLEKVYYVMKDLGVIFDPTFSFVRHVDFIVTKAYSMLGFMMRICADFNAASVFKSLYRVSHVSIMFSVIFLYFIFLLVLWFLSTCNPVIIFIALYNFLIFISFYPLYNCNFVLKFFLGLIWA